MASIGFGKSKEKSQTSGTNEVNPYAPTVGAIGEICLLYTSPSPRDPH